MVVGVYIGVPCVEAFNERNCSGVSNVVNAGLGHEAENSDSFVVDIAFGIKELNRCRG